jgi:hypothetical protein
MVQPMSVSDAVSLGVVDASLTAKRSQFTRIAEERAQELVRDRGYVKRVLREKELLLGAGTALRDMHRARMFEGIICRDNVKDSAFTAARHMAVHDKLPTATPLHLSGQQEVRGRILDGKGLGSLTVQNVRAAVDAHVQVSPVHVSQCMRGLLLVFVTPRRAVSPGSLASFASLCCF